MKSITRHRAAQVEVRQGTELIPCVVSSDAPYNRGDYTEILVHTQAAIDLSRAPLPVIESHDLNKLNIGVIEQLTIAGGKLRGMLRLGKSARAQEILQDIQDGIVSSLSIGYTWNKWTDVNDVVTVTRWQPLEVSLVAVPADINAGLYRNLNTMEQQMENQENEETTLSRSQRRAQRHNFENQQTAVEEERIRIRSIEALCKLHKVDQNVATGLIDDGATIEVARGAVLEILKARSYSPSTDIGSWNDGYGGGQDYGFSRSDKQDFSICRALVASTSKDWRKAGLERSMSDAIAKRAGRETEGFFVPLDIPMTRAPYFTGAPATGGNIVATNLLASSFIDILRNKCQVINLGATMLSGLVGNVDIPRRNAATTAYWVAEAGTITESEGTFDKISLSPKTVAALSRYSRNILLQSTPDIEMLVRGDLVEIVALAIDKASLFGLGTGNQPTGIFNIGGIGSVVGGANGVQVTLDHMMDLAAAVMNANAAGNSMGYLVNSKTQTSLSKQKSTTGQYLWARGGELTSIAERMVDRISGHPVLQTNQLPSNGTKGTGTNLSSLVFGDWSSLIIGEWGVLEILPNPYGSGFASGQVDIRAMQSVDIGVRHPESFAVMTDAITG